MSTTAGAGAASPDAPSNGGAASQDAPSNGRDAVMYVIMASLAFATSAPLARWARPAHPLVVAFGRVAIAGAVLLLADLPGVLASLRRMTWRQRGVVAGAGTLLAAHFALFLWGLDRTSLPAAVSLVALEPLGVVVCAWAFHGIRPRPLERVGVLVATAGALLVGRGAGSGEHQLVGDLLVLGAVILYGFYVTAARSLRDVLPARRYAGLVYACAAIALVPALAIAPPSPALWPLETHAIVAIVAMALVPTVIGHTAVQSAARRLSPSIVGLVAPGETLGALAIGAIVFQAIPTMTELAGAAVIGCGTVLAVRGSIGSEKRS